MYQPTYEKEIKQIKWLDETDINNSDKNRSNDHNIY